MCRGCGFEVFVTADRTVRRSSRPTFLLNPDSAIQMSEERTWNSEDTQPCSFKAFFALGRLPHGQCTDSQHLRLLACLEVECVVFAMEGLLLTHDLRSTE